MATTTAKKPRAAHTDDGATRALQQVIDDLDRMRGETGDELRKQLETSIKRMRDVATDLRERTDERTTNIERAVGRVADEAWQQIATLAVRAQRDPEALTELSAEIRRRKAQLRPPAKARAARKAG